jgi:hypothetical protein
MVFTPPDIAMPPSFATSLINPHVTLGNLAKADGKN